jgi:hypothetical protein
MYRTAEMQPRVANSHIVIGTFQGLTEHPNFAEIDPAKSVVAELKETSGHKESDPEFLKTVSSRIARNCDAVPGAKSSISATRPRAQDCHCESSISLRASATFRVSRMKRWYQMPRRLCGRRRGRFYLPKEARSGEFPSRVKRSGEWSVRTD